MGELTRGGEQRSDRFANFELLDKLAVGGMAELYRARPIGPSHADSVVIKRILPSLAANPRFRAMFEDEARIGARLRHANIARTLELGEHRGELFIAMELVDGVDVLELLREIAGQRVDVPAPVAAHIACEILEALDFAHAQTGADGRPLNIVHRDVSPANVLLSLDGAVKLVDFGIAKAVITGPHTQAGSVKGKYGYMSPEQVRGEALDGRSDLFSTAIVLSEMLIGRRLFTAGSDLDLLLLVRDANLARLEAHAAHIPEGLYAIVTRALSRNRDDRYATAGQMRDALRQWLTAEAAGIGAARVAEMVTECYGRATARRQRLASGSDNVPVAPPAPAADESGEWAEEDIEVLEEWTNADAVMNADTIVELSKVLSASDIEVVADDDEDDDDLEDEVIVAEQALPRSYLEEMDFSSKARAPRREARPGARQRARIPAVTMSPLPAKPAWVHSFADKSPFAALFELAGGQASGLLTVDAADARRHIRVRDGRIVGIASDDPAELLGARLVADGTITDDELDAALEYLPQAGGQLGAALVHLGYMTPLAVFRALTRQAHMRLVDLCARTRGEMSWHPGAAPIDPGFRLNLDIFDVLVEAALALPEGRVAPWRRDLQGRRAVPATRSADLPAAFSFGAVRRVWDVLPGRHPAPEVAGDDETARALLLLVEAGLAALR